MPLKKALRKAVMGGRRLVRRSPTLKKKKKLNQAQLNRNWEKYVLKTPRPGWTVADQQRRVAKKAAYVAAGSGAGGFALAQAVRTRRKKRR